MCTAISDWGTRHLFGRTLDLECSYGEEVILVPRKMPLPFLHEETQKTHPAMLGMGIRHEERVLYYDAANEHGLCVAALNFPHFAAYADKRPANMPHAVASFELIPWILGQCATVAQAQALLQTCCITAESVSSDLPATSMHWLLADGTRALVAEPTAEGLVLHENPWGVLTNSPVFSYHVSRLSEYMQLGAQPPVNRLCPSIPLTSYARGLGAMGLPGDYSSSSRFVRAVFAQQHTAPAPSAEISRFFHVMDTVAVPDGCIRTEDGSPVRTVYTACMDAAALRYYYTTYACRRIRCVSPDASVRQGSSAVAYPLQYAEDIADQES